MLLFVLQYQHVTRMRCVGVRLSYGNRATMAAAVRARSNNAVTGCDDDFNNTCAAYWMKRSRLHLVGLHSRNSQWKIILYIIMTLIFSQKWLSSTAGVYFQHMASKYRIYALHILKRLQKHWFTKNWTTKITLFVQWFKCMQHLQNLFGSHLGYDIYVLGQILHLLKALLLFNL